MRGSIFQRSLLEFKSNVYVFDEIPLLKQLNIETEHVTA